MNTSLHPGALLCVSLLVLVLAAAAQAGGIGKSDRIEISAYSQREDPAHSAIGAAVHVSEQRPGQQATTLRPARNHVRPAPAARASVGGTNGDLPAPYPPLASNSVLLRNPRPAGPQSFWYSDGGGHVCMYLPDSVLPCFTVVAPAGNPGHTGLTPAVIAASVARRLELASGQIEASPSRSGLTGADSWFWLDPAPQRQELSVSLGGETVNVVADPEVEWRFGDGATLDGGPGVPYQPGAAPAEAIRHVYQTRCLPGDQGRDPYVLASCGQGGYSLEALVAWRISYRAAGPIAETGALPARTTESSTVYPVSEARAFLVAGGPS